MFIFGGGGGGGLLAFEFQAELELQNVVFFLGRRKTDKPGEKAL